MSIPNTQCTKCGDIEPQDHDFNRDGLWMCPQCKTPIKKIDGKKPLDVFLDKLNDGGLDGNCKKR